MGLHWKEIKQENGQYFLKFVSSLYSLLNQMLQQMKQKEIFFDVFRIEEEKMIVITPGVL